MCAFSAHIFEKSAPFPHVVRFSLYTARGAALRALERSGGKLPARTSRGALAFSSFYLILGPVLVGKPRHAKYLPYFSEKIGETRTTGPGGGECMSPGSSVWRANELIGTDDPPEALTTNDRRPHGSSPPIPQSPDYPR